jgi:hypothetical protein
MFSSASGGSTPLEASLMPETSAAFVRGVRTRASVVSLP